MHHGQQEWETCESHLSAQVLRNSKFTLHQFFSFSFFLIADWLGGLRHMRVQCAIQWLLLLCAAPFEHCPLANLDSSGQNCVAVLLVRSSVLASSALAFIWQQSRSACVLSEASYAKCACRTESVRTSHTSRLLTCASLSVSSPHLMQECRCALRAAQRKQ